MANAERGQSLSLDAKLVAATNMAVAYAIWQTHYLQQGGTPAQSAEKITLTSVKQALKQLNEVATELAAEAADAPKKKAGGAGF